MKKLFTFSILMLIIVCMTFAATSSISAENDLELQSANIMVKLDLLKGYEDGSLGLENNIKRSEFITLVNRSFGLVDSTDLNGYKINFTDIAVKHWAYDHIRIAVKNKLVTGYPDKTIRPDNNVTYAEALTVIVKALGYESALKGSWPNNVLDKAKELKLTTNLDLASNKPITRGEMCVIVYNALTVNFKTD